MPQWDFLNFLAQQARKFPQFQLRMQHEAVDLIRSGERIDGVQVQTANGPTEIRAELVVGCDGRHSTTRQAAQLEVIEQGVPIDVLWFRISRRPEDPEEVFGNVNYGRALVLINRGDYFQGGFIIRKGSFEAIRASGIESFREMVRRIAPYFGDRVEELQDWSQIKLLSVQINRLRQWYRPGLLCIGDAAHAMSPAGGVGINLAIQDAVATARLLAGPLRRGRVSVVGLAAVQARRELPTVVTQQLQVFAHKGLEKIFQNPGPAKAPWQFKLAVQIPGIQRLTARIIGVGVRPEHLERARKGSALGAANIRRVAAALGIAAAVFIVNLRKSRPRVAGAA